MFGSQPGYAAAKARYRTIDIDSRVQGASPHGLIAVLYEELAKTLDTLALGVGPTGTMQMPAIISRRSRANSILLGLEVSLDHAQGGDLARGLSAIYREARRLIGVGIDQHDPNPIVQAREMIAEIAEAWDSIG
jgi:flagellar secretion chaperone FliS